jgi:phage tail-like protein
MSRVNGPRSDPYKNYRFRVFFDRSTTPVAGFTMMTDPKRPPLGVEAKDKAYAVGRQRYEAVTLERGITHDSGFERWTNATYVVDPGRRTQPLDKLRRTVIIVGLDEQARPAHRWTLSGCWISEYQAVPDLDAGANAVAIEHIKLVTEGWEHGSA